MEFAEGDPDLGPNIPVPPNVSLTDNMNQAANFPSWEHSPDCLKDKWYDPGRLTAFYEKVKPGGDWDYKAQGPQYENFGNFNYAATGAAAGIPESVLRRAAGAVQMYDAAKRFVDPDNKRTFLSPSEASWNPSYGTPLGGWPYGDQPTDENQMDRANYYLLTGNNLK
jgi:hypothetical protein